MNSNHSSGTYWRVEEVTERPGIVLAKLQRVEFFKTNPEYEAHADEVGWDGEQFVDAEPGEDGADSIEGDGPRITLDFTDGPDVHPLDVVALTVRVVSGVRADV